MERKKKEVAIIEPVGGHGGMNYYDFGLARSLAQNGYDVTIYTCDKTCVPKTKEFSVKLAFKKIYGNGNKLIRSLRFSRGLIKSLLHAKYNRNAHLVHFHFFHVSALEKLCVYAARIFGLQVIITVHDVESFSGEDSKKSAVGMYAAAAALIAHNKISQKEIVSKINIPAEKIAIIPHGNYLDYVREMPSRENARKKLGISEETPLVLFFGQIKKVKGLDVLLKAVPKILESIPDVNIMIAGKVWKDSFDSYQAIIEDLDIETHVKKDIRYIPDEEALMFYAAADLVVLPYRKIYQSGVLLMAMSSKRPVVVSDLPGMLEIVKNDKNGLVFKNGDENHLADQIIKAFVNPGKLRDLAEEGYKTVKTEHDWNHVGRMTATVYDKVLNS